MNYAKFSNFDRFAAVNICKECLQTASVFTPQGAFGPRGPLCCIPHFEIKIPSACIVTTTLITNYTRVGGTERTKKNVGGARMSMVPTSISAIELLLVVFRFVLFSTS